MTNQSTIDKLIEMRLTAMADAFRSQDVYKRQVEHVFRDRKYVLIHQEYLIYVKELMDIIL